MNNTCLILEGGGLRGAFTSGVLDYFLENTISFERVVAVSAGACNGASYLSKQFRRNWNVNVEAPADTRFMGLKHLLRDGSYFNMPFIFDEIPTKIYPFDEKAFYKNPAAFDVIVTSAQTGEPFVLSKEEMARIGLNVALQASSSIPLLAKPVSIDGIDYYDGGVSAAIPIGYALQKHDKAVIILTRQRGYRKSEKGHTAFYRFIFRKKPGLLKAMLKRNVDYNRTLDFCEQKEREGKLFIIAPSPEYTISRTEQNFERRANSYHHGYNCLKEESEKLIQFLQSSPASLERNGNE